MHKSGRLSVLLKNIKEAVLKKRISGYDCNNCKATLMNWNSVQVWKRFPTYVAIETFENLKNSLCYFLFETELIE